MLKKQVCRDLSWPLQTQYIFCELAKMVRIWICTTNLKKFLRTHNLYYSNLDYLFSYKMVEIIYKQVFFSYKILENLKNNFIFFFS